MVAPSTRDDEIVRRVVACLSTAHRIAPEHVHLDSRLEQLHIDSVAAISIVFALEEEFDVTIPEEVARDVRTVRDIVDGIRRLLSARPLA